MQTHPVLNILCLWPDRQSILADAQVADPAIELVAVHRWFQRGRIPSRHWASLIAGAKRRKIKLKADDLVAAHAGEQSGHKASSGRDVPAVQADMAKNAPKGGLKAAVGGAK